MSFDFDSIARQYVAAWNTTDAAERARLVAEGWAADCTYTDPLATVAGTEAVNTLIGAVQDQFAGCRINLLGTADGHHDVLRFRWELVPEGASESIVEGFDVVELDEGGRIRNVYGFLDKVPAMA